MMSLLPGHISELYVDGRVQLMLKKTANEDINKWVTIELDAAKDNADFIWQSYHI